MTQEVVIPMRSPTSRLAALGGAALAAVALAAGGGSAAGAARPVLSAFAERFGTDTGGAATAAGAVCTLGQVLLTASPEATAGGMPANGQLMPIENNEALFVLLGTTYGGDGQSTFALPDLRAVAPDHMTYSICTDGAWPQR